MCTNPRLAEKNNGFFANHVLNLDLTAIVARDTFMPDVTKCLVGI